MNWLNNFLEENKIKRANKAYLRNNMIEKIIEGLNENQLSLVDGQKILWENQKELDKSISTQKGRITRQTNEQNQEKETSEKAFDNIFQRLEKIEKKLNR